MDYEEDEYEPDYQPIPGKPGWSYDANRGPWSEGVTEYATLPDAMWRELHSAPLDIPRTHDKP